jgi:hypothetical protein
MASTSWTSCFAQDDRICSGAKACFIFSALSQRWKRYASQKLSGFVSIAGITIERVPANT